MILHRSITPWQLSHLLNDSRTVGEIALNKNGTSLDIWIRVDGKPCWFGVHREEILRFLNSDAEQVVLPAESDGNAEPAKVTGDDDPR